jgi:ferredoxin-NADP reductase
VFSIDQYEGAGFCLIAGGVGIAPALSMLETLADRGDVRPVVLFAGNRSWDSIILRDRIDELTARLTMTAPATCTRVSVSRVKDLARSPLTGAAAPRSCGRRSSMPRRRA